MGPNDNLSFTKGFLLQLIVLMVTLVSGYIYMKSDLKMAVELGAENKAEIKRYQADIRELQMQILILQEDVKYFRLTYDKDMNKYIREGADRRGR